MRVWLVTIGEPVPQDGHSTRYLRTGMLAQYLCARGHDVHWWTSSFDHMRKVHRTPKDSRVSVGKRLEISFIRSTGYGRNVSLSRLVDHALLAWKFGRQALQEQQPDIILASLPTVELAAKACEYGRLCRRPVVVDIRDLWPDIFTEALPPAIRPIAAALITPYRRLARLACAGASGIIGPAEDYVNWGITQAGRARQPYDRVFPFAYPNARLDDAVLSAARASWVSRGVAESDGRFNVCFFGTLGRQFDLETVLHASRTLAGTAPQVRFVICGAGDRETHYRKMASDCGNVLFAGWVDAAEIRTLMGMSSVGLAPYLPSRNFAQHIPNKPIEYLSAGLPVLTTLNGALGQLLGQTNSGVVYPAGDSEALAEAISRLARDPLLTRTLSRNAERLYSRQFLADTVYAELAEYLEVIAASQARLGS